MIVTAGSVRAAKIKKNDLNFESIDHSQHNFEKWVQVKENKVSEKTGRPIVVTIAKKIEMSMTSEELKNYFENEFKNFLARQHRCFFQANLTKKKASFVEGSECVLDIDWSENWQCKYATEIQAVHFGASRTQVSIHTGMLYTKNSKKGFATFSKSLRHDSCAVAAHFKKALGKISDLGLIGPEIDTIHIVSGGPTAQYKNKNMFPPFDAVHPNILFTHNKNYLQLY